MDIHMEQGNTWCFVFSCVEILRVLSIFPVSFLNSHPRFPCRALQSLHTMWFKIAASTIDDAAGANAGANDQGHWKYLELWDHGISRSILEKPYILLLVERRRRNYEPLGMEAWVFEWRYNAIHSHVVELDRVTVKDQ